MELVIGLLPFAILAAFWFFLTRSSGTVTGAKPIQDELAGIRQELERIRRALEAGTGDRR